MKRVTRLRDAMAAVCRDCGREFSAFDSPYWDLGTLIAMHSHRNADGTWRKSAGVKRCVLYGASSAETPIP